MDSETVEKGRAQIRTWDTPERVSLTKLTPREAALIVEAAARFDLRPCDPIEPSARVVEIP